MMTSHSSIKKMSSFCGIMVSEMPLWTALSLAQNLQALATTWGQGVPSHGQEQPVGEGLKKDSETDWVFIKSSVSKKGFLFCYKFL